MKAKQVLSILGITRQTLCNYVKSGKVKIASKFSNNFFEYDDDSIYQLIGNKKQKNNRMVISYSRVSTQNQKEQLVEQSNRIYNSCISRGINLDKQFEEIKSGMSCDRKQFQVIIQMIIENKVELLIIENKDRLVRFGYETLEQIFKYFGTKILILNDVVENKTYEQELTDDLISIIHYFSMKSYSHRRKLNKIKRELEDANLKNSN